MYFSVTTFGCKVNQYESSGIVAIMKQAGYAPLEEADGDINVTGVLYIINSCTVTENSDRKVKNLIIKLKSKNPNAKVVLCGCFPRAFPEKAVSTGADIIIPGIFKSIDDLNEQLSIPSTNIAPIAFNLSPAWSPQDERTRAFLKIQDGCNRSCAYCIIPKARGPVTSRAIADIQAEAAMLAKAGHKEIVITGINLCAYEYSLVDAVESVCNTDGVHRVRLGSIEPDMIGESDIARLAAYKERLCAHFHLSLQSGSDSVLKRMNRQYTTNDYRKVVQNIRKFFPACAITTDIIAGFPGESDNEFAQTLEFAEEIGFAKIHAFAFSSREGTLAAVMPEQLPKAIKHERARALDDLSAKMRAAFFESLIGTEQEILFESPDFGNTRCYTPVKTLKAYKKREIARLKIIKAEKDYCIAE